MVIFISPLYEEFDSLFNFIPGYKFGKNKYPYEINLCKTFIMSSISWMNKAKGVFRCYISTVKGGEGFKAKADAWVGEMGPNR